MLRSYGPSQLSGLPMVYPLNSGSPYTQYSLVFYSSEPPCLLCLPLVNVPTCQLASSSAAFLPTGQLINRSTISCLSFP